MAIWRALVGESDDDEEDFHGFTLEKMTKGEESDVDLDIVVHGGILESDNELSEDNSSDNSRRDERESASDDDLPVPRAPRKRKRASKQKTKKAKVDVSWTDQIKDVTIEHKFTPKPTVTHTLPPTATPMDFFDLFVPDLFFKTLSEQTNKYATQKQAAAERNDRYWTETTPDEMKIFLYIQYMFGIHHLPEADMYWSLDPLLRVPAIADVMGKSRYQKINQYFHIRDNTEAFPKTDPQYDPLFKVRPLLDLVKEKSHAHYNPGREISVDEAMIKFNGRLSFKQYVKGKPNPWGIKVWCAADPRTGYMLEYDVYLGRIKEPMTNGVGHHVINKMGARFLDKGHHLYFDNFFSSVKLAADLLEKKTYSCSTIRVNREGWPADLRKAQMKKMKKGEVHFRQDGNLVATVWRDKRAVAVLSTNADAKTGSVTRKSPGGTKDVTIPQPIIAYNAHMGGVDLMDQHHAYYPVGRPSVKWWRYLCWWLFQSAMINAYIVFKETQKQQGQLKIMKHISFRLDVLRALSAGRSVRQRVPAQSVSMEGVTASDPVSHAVSKYPGRKQNCFQCQNNKRHTPKGYASQSNYGCLLCCVHLCKAPCFAQFHLQLAQQH